MPSGSRNTVVDSNTIVNCTYAGVSIVGSYSNYIKSNNIMGSLFQTSVEEKTGQQTNNNTFISNTIVSSAVNQR